MMKPRLGQGRAGLKRKVKVTSSQPNKQAQIEPTPLERQKSKIREQPEATVGIESQTEHIPIMQSAPKKFFSPRTFTKQVPPYPDPLLKPPPRPPDLKESWKILSDLDIDTDINTDF